MFNCLILLLFESLLPPEGDSYHYCFIIHVKSPVFAGRLPEIYQISCSPGRENKPAGFLMKLKILCGLTKDRQSLPLRMPTTTAGVSSIWFCAEWTNETKQYPCVLPVVEVIYTR